MLMFDRRPRLSPNIDYLTAIVQLMYDLQICIPFPHKYVLEMDELLHLDYPLSCLTMEEG